MSGHTASVAPRGAGPSITVAATTGRCSATECGHLGERGVGLGRHGAYEDSDLTAAGEPDGERVLVAVAEGLQLRLTGLHDLLGQFEDRALHAAAGDAADDLRRPAPPPSPPRGRVARCG